MWGIVILIIYLQQLYIINFGFIHVLTSYLKYQISNYINNLITLYPWNTLISWYHEYKYNPIQYQWLTLFIKISISMNKFISLAQSFTSFRIIFALSLMYYSWEIELDSLHSSWLFIDLLFYLVLSEPYFPIFISFPSRSLS